MDEKPDDETSKQPKIKAEDNPWYRLATLYGHPDIEDLQGQARNREAWNRCVAEALTEHRLKELSEKRCVCFLNENLTPFSENELLAIEQVFLERSYGREVIKFSNLNWNDVDFSHVVFDDYVSFKGFIFPGNASFRHAIFSDYVAFERASFAEVHFDDATFSTMADFTGASFEERVGFNCANFSGEIFFDKSSFSAYAVFLGAKFRSLASFDSVVFFENAFFQNVTFDFGASFVNTELKGETSFERAVFVAEPPKFFGAKMHEGTVWRDATWPIPKAKDKAGSFVDAYERLKLEMDNLKKHEAELDFFALELRSRVVLHGALSTSSFPIFLYGLLSDYGRSYLRPLLNLLISTLAGAAVLLPHVGISQLTLAIGLSFANTFSALGFRKDFIDPNIIKSLPPWLMAFSALQTIFGIVLLFLFVLSIRNRLRMK